MKAQVDQDTCIGCGACTETCPAVFEMGDDDVSKVKVEVVPAGAENDCRQAVDGCPVEAISIEE